MIKNFKNLKQCKNVLSWNINHNTSQFFLVVPSQSQNTSFSTNTNNNAFFSHRNQQHQHLLVTSITTPKTQFHNKSSFFEQSENLSTEQQPQESSSIDFTPTSFKQDRITIFGGSGYLGKHLLDEIVQLGHPITIACRYPESFKQYLSSLPGDYSNVEVKAVDISEEMQVEPLIMRSKIVINMANIYYESEHRFTDVFIDGSRIVAHLSKKHNVDRLIKIGYLGSSPLAVESKWSENVSRGEDLTYAAFPEATVLKPSLMFGGGSPLERLAKSIKSSPVIPIPNTGKFQPIWVEDVVSSIMNCLKDDSTKGQVYELGGPEVYSTKDLITQVLHNAYGTSRMLVPLPTFMFDFVIGITSTLPQPNITRDHSLLCLYDSVEDENTKTAKDLGIKPTNMEEFYTGKKQ